MRIFTESASNALRHGSHSFTCKLHHACLYFLASEHHRPLAGTHFTVPRRLEGGVDLGGWLHTEIKCRIRESNSDTRTVIHPSTNRAQRRLTSLISTNDATTMPRRHPRNPFHSELSVKTVLWQLFSACGASLFSIELAPLLAV